MLTINSMKQNTTQTTDLAHSILQYVYAWGFFKASGCNNAQDRRIFAPNLNFLRSSAGHWFLGLREEAKRLLFRHCASFQELKLPLQ